MKVSFFSDLPTSVDPAVVVAVAAVVAAAAGAVAANAGAEVTMIPAAKNTNVAFFNLFVTVLIIFFIVFFLRLFDNVVCVFVVCFCLCAHYTTPTFTTYLQKTFFKK
jgi:hypothetical protein